MKKLILFIMIFIMLLIPATGNAVTSPVLKDLYHFNPEIEFDFLDQTKTTLDLEYWEPFKFLKELDEDIEPNAYHIDDAFVLYLKEEYKAIEIVFPIPYETDVTIFGVIFTEEEECFITGRIITSTGSVVFNFETVPPEKVIMYIVSNKEA